MTVLDLARLEFALTAGTHFLFVALTLGLATLVACVQTRATLRRDTVDMRMVRFWGQLYVINYAVGIVTGLVMELQLGLNWSGLGHFAGNVFGPSLALETLTAFFVESTFLGLWIFGWGRLNRWAHLVVIWVVTLTGYASAYWIMVSNGFLHHPVGAQVVGGVLRLSDAGAVLANPNAVLAFGHILSGALVTGGLVMAGVSAYHLRRGSAGQDLYRRSLRIGVWVTLPALLATIALGGLQFGNVADAQPFRLPVFTGDATELTSLQADAVARFGPGDYVPSSASGIAAYVMIVCWVLLFVVTVIGLARRGQRLLTWAIPLPFVAMLAGWVFREIGRQPWTVYGLLRTEDAVSDLGPTTMTVSLAAFTVLFGLLAAVNLWLLGRHARRGPDAAALGRPPGELPAPPLPAATY